MLRPGPPESCDTRAAWDRLRARVAAQAGWLCSPLPAGPGVCRTCRGPADADYARCFQCDLHVSCAPGLLADAVVPVSYAVKGGRHAANLWRYKSGRPEAGTAGAALLSLLLAFLRDHGRCVWQAAGFTAPTHVATVPSTRGRAGPHPLRVMVAGCLRLPPAELAIAVPAPVAAPGLAGAAGAAGPAAGLACPAPGPPGPAPYPEVEPDDRELQPDLFTAQRRLDGARVLLIDDTWTTGARAQSAAAAAKLAGAREVAVVVLGRHLNPADFAGQPFGRVVSGRGFRAGACAEHPPPVRD
jgi:hypothetical protein